MSRLTERRAERADIPRQGQAFLRCSELRGFFVRTTATGHRSYGVEFKKDGKNKRIILGEVGVLPFETVDGVAGAVDLAKAALATGRRGEDAAVIVAKKKMPAGKTLNEVWADYESAGYPKGGKKIGRKRPSTISADKNRWNAHVAKTIGKKPVSEITNTVVDAWLDGIMSRGQRSQCLILVKSILAFANKRNLATVNKIDRVAEKSREMQNFYSDEQRTALDAAAAALAIENPHRPGFVAVRIVLRTGARLGEILGAQWDWIDRDRMIIRLPQDKTNDDGRDIHLSQEDLDIIDRLPRVGLWIFPGDAGKVKSKSGHLERLQKVWPETVKRAGVPLFRVHDMRHSYVSALVRNGISLYVAGKLAGHRNAATTQRYSHLQDDTLRAAHTVSTIAPAKPDLRIAA